MYNDRKAPAMVFFCYPEMRWNMENQKQSDTIQIGNTTFYVTATFSGTVQLQHLIKRLIQKEIEQENSAG
jgi:hypothetical protein